jgi:5-(carboxyamino)imidazole ribonucleotide mutase
MANILVGIIMGSKSDLPIMQEAAKLLDELGVKYELTVVSAHRTPERLMDYAKTAAARGLKVIIAGAGGAAHLPGMVASATHLPVIGVPVKSSNSIDGWDSVLSILQMPSGVPVATVALNGAANAGILAAQIVGTFDENVSQNLVNYKTSLKDKVIASALELKGQFGNSFDKKTCSFFCTLSIHNLPHQFPN